MSGWASEVGEGSRRRRRPRIWDEKGIWASGEPCRRVPAGGVIESCRVICCGIWWFVFGAEIAVLGGGEGEIGVDWRAELTGDNIAGSSESSARTTSAGVPLVKECSKRRL